MAYDLDDIPDFDSTPSYSPRKINSDDSYWEKSDDVEEEYGHQRIIKASTEF